MAVSGDGRHATEKRLGIIRNERVPLFGIAGMGVVGVALLFGSAAMALALIAAPIAENIRQAAIRCRRRARPDNHRLDRGRGAYTIRKSVLQSSPDSVCIIRDNGLRSGDC